MKFLLPICALAVAALPAAAEPPRDPMQPPASAQPASAASAPSDRGDAAPRHIVVVGTTRYLVDQGRRLSVGDLLGERRIERIDGDAVWLRDARGAQRVPLYPGVTRRAAADSPAPSASSPTRQTTKDVPR
ncbi:MULTISPECIES: hypothetical protein [unclassified Rhizobacter]|uniref:hypothetical protein n=1 Tax=unclassified Rhizobacter TaxID=2640088 RepID=UPI0006FAB045|nr:MULTISPECIES: hypothetical protein [unclassified Rhizobacter]KQU74569.1 hypothetical protein ASC88_26840 [Rhizobacter sp. Root29]KQW13475.1 hypothetical protein ASC98_18225 [Rhizobacter sp. Root1238]KRB23108.1 hypothetical protein ASE08_20690 [Rhizobacter sp. Root16D2]